MDNNFFVIGSSKRKIKFLGGYRRIVGKTTHIVNKVSTVFIFRKISNFIDVKFLVGVGKSFIAFSAIQIYNLLHFSFQLFISILGEFNRNQIKNFIESGYFSISMKTLIKNERVLTAVKHTFGIKVVLAVLVFIFTCVGLSCRTTVDARVSREELEIYKKLLADKPKNIVVLTPETNFAVFGIDRNNFKEILKGVRDDTFDHFVEINSITPKIEDDVKADFNYPLVNGSDFNNDNLEHARYYSFSRVGFSRNGKQAVVMFSDVCHPLCTYGAYYLLENKNGVWEVVQESEYIRS